jgi:hypothetical protein
MRRSIGLTVTALGMGIFDGIRSAFGDLSVKSDTELEEEYEALRLRSVSHSKVDNQLLRIQKEMDRYNAEMVRRANAAYVRENPNPQRVHREHGWYVSKDE